MFVLHYPTNNCLIYKDFLFFNDTSNNKGNLFRDGSYIWDYLCILMYFPSNFPLISKLAK